MVFHVTSRLLLGSPLLALAIALAGCDEKTPQKSAPARNQEPAAENAAPLPKQPDPPPELVVDNIGPKVGFARINLQFPEGRAKLAAEIAAVRQRISTAELRLTVDRKANPEWVEVYLAELGAAGFDKVVIRTETRGEYPAELRFVPDSKVGDAPPCSVVAMILEDRGTAVWKLGGGVAGKRGKGMAGPDLTMTGETIERNAKACKNGSLFFVAGAPSIEWGLVYDLAASASTLEGVRFESRVLLSETPVPGHKVALPRPR